MHTKQVDNKSDGEAFFHSTPLCINTIVAWKKAFLLFSFWLLSFTTAGEAL